jgi:hypothetical protein
MGLKAFTPPFTKPKPPFAMSCANKQMERTNAAADSAQRLKYFKEFVSDTLKDAHLWDGLGIDHDPEDKQALEVVNIVERAMNGEEITKEDVELLNALLNESNKEIKDVYMSGTVLNIPPDLLVPFEDLANYSLLDISWLRLKAGWLCESMEGKIKSKIYYNLKDHHEREMDEFYDTRRRLKEIPVPWVKEIKVVKTTPQVIEEETVFEPYPPQPRGFREVVEILEQIYSKLYTLRMYYGVSDMDPQSGYIPCPLAIYNDFLKPLGYLATYDKGFVLITL